MKPRSLKREVDMSFAADNNTIPPSIMAEVPTTVRAQLAGMSLVEGEEFLEEYQYRRRDPLIAVLLAIFLGMHYAYRREWGLQVAFWFTFGGLGVWWIIDMVRIHSATRRDNRNAARSVVHRMAFTQSRQPFGIPGAAGVMLSLALGCAAMEPVGAEPAEPDVTIEAPIADDDGCYENCEVEPAAFRIATMTLASPSLEGASQLLRRNLTRDNDGDGATDLNILLMFRPLAPSDPATAVDVLAVRHCTRGDSFGCRFVFGDTYAPATADNAPRGGECQLGGSQLRGPCFTATPVPMTEQSGPLGLPLRAAQLAGRYANPTSHGGARTLRAGVLRGFMPEHVAAEHVLPAELGGGMLADELAAEELVVGPSAQTGWWFHFDFEAARVPLQEDA